MTEKDSSAMKKEEGRPVGKEPQNGTKSSAKAEGVLDVNQFILISGLVSEEGKKLNGCEGILLDQPKADEQGVLRYPVLIFAKEEDCQANKNKNNDNKNGVDEEDDLLSIQPVVDGKPQGPTATAAAAAPVVLVPLAETSTKKIKADNLSLVPHLATSLTMFWRVANKEKKKFEADSDWKNTLFWAKLLQQVFPNKFWTVLNCVGLLRDHGRGPKDRKLAYDIVQSYKGMIPPSEDCYHILCYELFATHYALHTYEQKQMQTSLDLALNIPTDDTTNDQAIHHARNALLVMEQDYHRFMTHDRNWKGRAFLHPEMATDYLRCVKAVLSLVPPDDITNVDRFDQMGTYFAVTRQNMKAAKCYRRAFQIITQDLPPAATGSAAAKQAMALSQLKQKLIMTQLGCPGRLHDGYHIVRMTATHDYGVELSQVSLYPHVQEQEFPRPTDPNDAQAFPEAFLAEISTNVMGIFEDLIVEGE